MGDGSLEEAGGEARVDARGLLCPLPLVRMTALLEASPVGTTILLLADDPGAVEDVRLWCAGHGQVWLGSQAEGRTHQIRVRRAR
jgi:TusA-related sulfurtransferase